MFWSDDEEGDEILFFTDNSSLCRPLVRKPLTYRPNAGMEKVHSANDCRQPPEPCKPLDGHGGK